MSLAGFRNVDLNTVVLDWFYTGKLKCLQFWIHRLVATQGTASPSTSTLTCTAEDWNPPTASKLFFKVWSDNENFPCTSNNIDVKPFTHVSCCMMQLHMFTAVASEPPIKL